MKPFVSHRGLVVPMNREHVDTDTILPKQFMKSIERTGYGPFLFDGLRYLDEGHPGMDCSARRPNPEFVLNEPRYQGASILLARRNFGCGSSREHAPWALEQFGLRVLIAPSFADIFYGNCIRNGLLPVVLDEDEVSQLFEDVARTPGYELHVDLEQQKLSTPSCHLSFELDPRRKEMLLRGIDEIALTLTHAPEIELFENRRRVARPWLFGGAPTH
jgi:3-isopropylmalate/(R)-2-methylmalate dehydratase small subunit